MAFKLSAKGQSRVAVLTEFQQKVQRIYGLVEQYASARGTGSEVFAMSLKRQLAIFKRELMGAGMDQLSQLAAAMEIAAARGTNQQFKTRVLREGVGSLKFQIEFEQRLVVSTEFAEWEKAVKEGKAEA